MGMILMSSHSLFWAYTLHHVAEFSKIDRTRSGFQGLTYLPVVANQPSRIAVLNRVGSSALSV